MSEPFNFDVEAFRDWFGARGTPLSSGAQVTPMKGGASCEMFRLEDGPQAWVIRRAPLARVAQSAHQVVREARIMTALGQTDVPVPQVVAAEETGEVLGAPFFVMEHVEGAVVRRSGLPASYAARPETHDRVGTGLIDTLATLHAVEWRSTDLEDVGHPDGFLERQVERWSTQLASYRCRDLDGVDQVAEWLETNRPASGDVTLMHGDYKLDNLMLSLSPPARVVSVMDFEMTTIGDPLIDLAWALIFWPEEGNVIALAPPGSPGGLDADHCQSPAELADRYAAATGRSLDNFDWYQAFSAWKLALVLEGSYAKFLSGESKNPHHELFGFVVDELLKRARRFAA